MRRRAVVYAVVCGLVLIFLPAQLRSATPDFTVQTRAQLLDAVSGQLRDYIHPDVAQTVRDQLQQDRATLIAIPAPDDFARAVTADMRSAGHDKHLALVYSADLLPPDQNPTPAEVAHDRESTILHNAGIRNVQWLPGNIGYIRITGFPSGGASTEHAIDAAMAVVAHTDALIVDLRHNGGGDPDSLDYWMGYFFDKRTELTSIKWTSPKPHVDLQFSASKIGGSHYLKPIYVLTSSRTFSCAEQFTYDLKVLRRASIVGETTGGGANPGDFRRLDPHFAIFIPTGQAYNPYTKTNWEGVGVAPDVASPAPDALVNAYTLTLRNAANSFDELVLERQSVLKDPAATLKAIFTP